MADPEKQENLEKVAILIDGGNFYKNLRFLGLKNLLNFNFKEFAEFLSKGREIIIKRYYKGLIRKEADNPKSQEMVSNQQRLFAALKEQQWEIKEGSMLKYPDFGECEGFYLTDKKITDKKCLQEIGKEILLKFKICYKPIIILTPNLSIPEIYKIFEKDKENLKSSKGLYLISNKWREKGVDVRIATDMLISAYKDICDSIILVSNDSDLVPAVEAVREKGIEVEYIGFEKRYSISLLGASDRKFLLTKEELEEFLPKTLI